jgi:D-xylonolactonase
LTAVLFPILFYPSARSQRAKGAKQVSQPTPQYPPPEIIQDAGLQCGEGPMWDPEAQCLYWTDAMGRAVYRYDRRNDAVVLLTDAVHAASVVLHREGGLILGGAEGFFHWRADRPLRLVAGECEDRPAHKINDLIADPQGRVFGGQETFREDGPYEPGYLFRVDPDGSIRIVEEGLHLANGMGFSPDLTSFYLTDTIQRRIYRYDFRPATGEIRNRRVLIELDRQDGLPDGMTVDQEGFLWVARWFGGAISRFDPEGALERSIEVPAAQPSSVAFGGPGLDELYVTSAATHWESPVAPVGHDYTRPRGGQVFRLRPGVQGRPEFRAGI